MLAAHKLSWCIRCIFSAGGSPVLSWDSFRNSRGRRLAGQGHQGNIKGSIRSFNLPILYMFLRIFSLPGSQLLTTRRERRRRRRDPGLSILKNDLSFFYHSLNFKTVITGKFKFQVQVCGALESWCRWEGGGGREVPPPPKYVQGGGGTRAAGAAAWGGTQPREHGLPKEERGKESPKKYSKEGARLCFKKKSMSSIKFWLFFALDFSLNHFLYFKNYLDSPEKLFKISMVFGGKLDMGESTRN